MQVAELFAKLGLQVDRKSWSVGNDVIAGLGKALTVWAGYKVVSGIHGMIDEVAQLGGRIDDLRQQTGIGSEAIQELGYAALQNGSNMEAAVGAVKKFTKGLEDAAATGKGPVADGLRSIGLSLGRVRDTVKREGLDAAIEQIADKIAGMPDGTKKAAAAMSVFGKTGSELIPLLNSGGEGIRNLREEARKLGLVMDDDSVRGLADFGDDMDRVKTAWQGVKQSIVVALLPTLRKMVEGLREWIIANRQVIVDKITSFVHGLAAALRLLGRAVAFVVEHWEYFAAALIDTMVVTGIIRLIKFIEWLRLASTAAAAKTLLAWTAAAAPFILLGAAVAAIALLVIKYKKQAREIFNWIIGRMVAIVNWITSLPGRALSALTALGNLIKTKIGEAWDWVKQKAEDTWDYITSIPGRVKDWALDTVNPFSDDSQTARASVPIAPGQAGWIAPSRRGPAVVQVTNGPMTINVPAGANPADYEAAVRKGVKEEWANQMNHALSDAGED